MLLILMPPYKSGTYRPIRSYLKQRLSERQVTTLSGSGAVDDELWIILEYYSEVQSVGMERFKGLGVKNKSARKRLFDNFQGYIRQAKNYYYSAKTLPARSSGLLYYYCFLNLSKAAILVKFPSIAGRFIHHGLTYRIANNSPLSKQTVKLRRNGVFGSLYDWYFGTPLSQGTFNIETLLSYCTDITFQNTQAGIQQTKIVPAYFAGASDDTRKTNWGVVGLYRLDEVSKYKKTMSQFFSQFELVDLPEHTAKEVFNINFPTLGYISFFQSIQERSWTTATTLDLAGTRNEALQALRPVFQTQYIKDDTDFKISLPYMLNRQTRMDEMIAIYIVMFYISNLVRYKPAYLERLS